MTDGDKKSFWTTLPGVLTAIAGILGSIVAILTILNPSTPPVEDLNPTIEEFIAIPFEIGEGETTTLKWDVSGPGSDLKITIDQGIGEVASSGTEKVTLDKSTSFTLSVVDGKGRKDKETIQVIVKEKKAAPSSGGDVLVVDSISGGDYLTISDAINAAEDGDTIKIHPGIYHEGLVIDKRLSILGDGDLGDVVIKATGDYVLRFTASLAEVSNLVLKQEGGGDFYAVDIGMGTPTLKGCDITSQSLACVAIHGDADPHIDGNKIHDGKVSGILVYDDGRGTIEHNEIYVNGHSGIEIREDGNPTINNNEIHDGKQAGIYVHDGGQGIIEDNDIFENALAGIIISEGGNPTISNSEIHDGKSAGIVVYDDGLGTIEDNEIFKNALAGIEIREGGNPTIRKNEIRDGKAGGILVQDNGLGTIEDNEIFENALSGIEIREGGDPTVTGNRINRNTYYGIWIHDGGAGSFKNNDLRENVLDGWKVSDDSTPRNLGGNVE